jgi:hypothetical protein
MPRSAIAMHRIHAIVLLGGLSGAEMLSMTAAENPSATPMVWVAPELEPLVRCLRQLKTTGGRQGVWPSPTTPGVRGGT